MLNRNSRDVGQSVRKDGRYTGMGQDMIGKSCRTVTYSLRESTSQETNRVVIHKVKWRGPLRTSNGRDEHAAS